MKLNISKHAIYRYKTRVRDCATKEVVAQIEAAYATGHLVHEFFGGHRHVSAGSLRLVISPKNLVLTVYLQDRTS